LFLPQSFNCQGRIVRAAVIHEQQRDIGASGQKRIIRLEVETTGFVVAWHNDNRRAASGWMNGQTHAHI
jgi:hypothetical protein